MKSPEIFKHYIWMTNTIRHAGRITLNELNERWIKTEMSGGLSMPRTTFNRHRKAIEDIFDICIGCQRCGDKYLYFIENEELLKDNNLHLWMLDFLSIGNLLMESSALKDRIILENIPAGKDYLQPIIDAMKIGRKLKMTYQKFGQADARTVIVEPYAIKVFKQRWYMLARNSKYPDPTIYALDRALAIEETAESFEYPSDFDTEQFFKDYYGVMCFTADKTETIVIRAYPPFMHYLRTLPLHHSQKELESTAEYADFEFHLKPTFDFCQELLSQAHEVEVLKPEHLRERITNLLEKTMQRYGWKVVADTEI